MKRAALPVAAVLLSGVIAGGYYTSTFLHGQDTAPAKSSALAEPYSFRNIVKKVLPAVVSIEAKSKPVALNTTKRKRQLPAEDPRIPEEFRKFFEDFGGAFPDEGGAEPRLGFGSGFIVDPKGIVLTNFHVVSGADSVIVQLHDGRKFTSKEIHGDRRTDLAVVKLDTKGSSLPFLAMGDSDVMEIGDRVLAVGAPFGLRGSVTSGIVSAKGRNGLNMNMYEDFIQTDAAINPGNSGGPLINMEGQVVGINSAIKSRSGGFQGVGLAIASNLAKHVTKALSTDGVVHRGYLGVQIRDLEPGIAERLNLPKDTGVVVGEVFENTPASKAGLQAGDIITAIAGKRIGDSKVLQGIVAGLPLRQPVEVNLFRDGKSMKLDVKVEEQPEAFGRDNVPAPRRLNPDASKTTLGNTGLDVADLTDDMADDLGFRKGTHGVVITDVKSGSVAAEAGLKRGMLIARIDNERVASAAAARTAVEKGSLQKGVLLQVQSPTGGVNYVMLKSEA